MSRRPASPLRSTSLEPLEGQRLAALRERHELGVLLTVRQRVEAEHGRLRRRLELRKPKREPVAGPLHGRANAVASE